MNPALWDSVSEQFSTWLTANETERQQLRSKLSPEVIEELESLDRASSDDFLETPALVLLAHRFAEETAALAGTGHTIGPYRIVSLLACGGMGDVYRATDERLQRDVAIKVLADLRPEGSRRIDRFMLEARVTASLDHPNVVRVFDVGCVEGRAFLVAELLEGETLRTRISSGAIPPPEVVNIARDIANGLAAAHAAGLVHRDLKPDNIFLTRSGPTKILDFGIAKLVQHETVPGGFSTETGVILGTAGYIAPEQIRSQPVDHRADLFALGAVIYEMLTGECAFARDHLVESLHAILHDSPSAELAIHPELPEGLKQIVLRLLEKRPEDRFQSAEAVIDALDRADELEV